MSTLSALAQQYRSSVGLRGGDSRRGFLLLQERPSRCFEAMNFSLQAVDAICPSCEAKDQSPKTTDHAVEVSRTDSSTCTYPPVTSALLANVPGEFFQITSAGWLRLQTRKYFVVDLADTSSPLI